MFTDFAVHWYEDGDKMIGGSSLPADSAYLTLSRADQVIELRGDRSGQPHVYVQPREKK